MATVQDPSLDNNQGQGQTGNFNQPIGVSGSSAAPSGAGGYKNNSSTSALTNAPTNSGSYQNLQGYLNANQNYINNGGLSNQISNDYNNQAQNLQNNINNNQQNWYNANSTKDFNPDQSSQYVQNVLQNPSQYASDPKQFQQYLTAQNNYVAPDQFDANQSLQNQLTNYQQAAGQLTSDSGRQSILQQLYSNPFYNQGQSQLDNMILSAGINSNGQGQLQNLQANMNQYGQNLQNAYGGAQQSIQNASNQYAQDAAATQAATQAALGNSIGGLNSSVQQALAADQANRTNSINTDTSLLQSNKLPSYIQQNFGVDPNKVLYGVDPSKYLNPNTQTYTAQNTITPEQQAQMSALNSLSGGFLTGDGQNVLSQYANNSQAGSANLNPYTYNSSGLYNDINSAQNNFNSGLKNIINQAYTGGYAAPIGAMDPSGASALLNQIKGATFENPNSLTQANATQNDLYNLLSQYGFNPSTGQGTTFNQSSNSGNPIHMR